MCDPKQCQVTGFLVPVRLAADASRNGFLISSSRVHRHAVFCFARLIDVFTLFKHGLGCRQDIPVTGHPNV